MTGPTIESNEGDGESWVDREFADGQRPAEADIDPTIAQGVFIGPTRRKKILSTPSYTIYTEKRPEVMNILLPTGDVAYVPPSGVEKASKYRVRPNQLPHYQLSSLDTIDHALEANKPEDAIERRHHMRAEAHYKTIYPPPVTRVSRRSR